MLAPRIASALFIPLLATAIRFLTLKKTPVMTPVPGTPWVDGPCQLVKTPLYETKRNDTFTKGATHMALIHNSILRGYNSIYHQAVHVQPADYEDFINYCLTWFHLVKSHHDDEEEQLFPKIEEILGRDDIWSETHDEHKDLLENLPHFYTYLTTLDSPSNFSGTKLLDIMSTFQEPFNHHFHSEIRTIAALAPETMSGAEPPEVTAAGPIFKAWGKNSIMKAGMMDVVPFIFLNFDRTFEDGMWKDWPPMPGLIRWALVRVGAWWHSGWWKFASCDVDGNPKALYALPKLTSEAEK